MTSKRKFYKTVFEVEVLSDEPLQEGHYSLSDIDSMITNGSCSGVIEQKPHVILNGKETAAALNRQGSDPEFFQLDENGLDAE